MTALHTPSLPGSEGPREFTPLTVRVSEACRLTGIGRSKLYELIKEKQIDVVKVGSMTLIPVRSLEAFLDLSRS